MNKPGAMQRKRLVLAVLGLGGIILLGFIAITIVTWATEFVKAHQPQVIIVLSIMIAGAITYFATKGRQFRDEI